MDEQGGLPPASQVFTGFDQAMEAALRLLRAADRIDFLGRGEMLEEFLLLALEQSRDLQARAPGGRIRAVACGAPSRDSLDALEARGIAVRMLKEDREVGLVVSDDWVLMFPSDQGPDDPLPAVVVEVRDASVVTHLAEAFERTWQRAAAPGPATPAARMREGERRDAVDHARRGSNL